MGVNASVGGSATADASVGLVNLWATLRVAIEIPRVCWDRAEVVVDLVLVQVPVHHPHGGGGLLSLMRMMTQGMIAHHQDSTAGLARFVCHQHLLLI